MEREHLLRGVLLEDAALTLEEIARACAVEPDWIVQRVRTGILLGGSDAAPQAWRFTSVDLVRARRLLQVERDFDANEEVAALVVDLSEEIRRLRGMVGVSGSVPQRTDPEVA
ncbi:MerR family transcriptional regulator [Pseudoduganella chitinolytica]|uniref:MerR family transcriptional regulator n=1 Tax=Pseudoduganella chitinolytica TaxID=34070 RepID=A0ABY8BLH7_9BURK|nr:MerR family transcriptional regulator [Pseudoduganella chitinolytica]WEF35788.1 MerR family transcriptional regulator [Pseudoduganella chitinolytica]